MELIQIAPSSPEDNKDLQSESIKGRDCPFSGGLRKEILVWTSARKLGRCSRQLRTVNDKNFFYLVCLIDWVENLQSWIGMVVAHGNLKTKELPLELFQRLELLSHSFFFLILSISEILVLFELSWDFQTSSEIHTIWNYYLLPKEMAKKHMTAALMIRKDKTSTRRAQLLGKGATKQPFNWNPTAWRTDRDYSFSEVWIKILIGVASFSSSSSSAAQLLQEAFMDITRFNAQTIQTFPLLDINHHQFKSIHNKNFLCQI